MRYALAPVALAAIANALPQGVTSAITPPTSAPAGCSPDYSGEFQIQVVNVTTAAAKRSFQKRQAGQLLLKLQGGILTDAQGRTGYIAANRQFQFDGPAQTGAIYTAGWSVCQNGTLAIGNDAIFQQCLSGTFYNLYDEATEEQCSPVYIDVIGAGSRQAAASVQPDGQPTASPVAQIPDGQIQQISDGQIQAPTGSPVNQIGDGQIQAATSAPAAPITQIGDGQIQAPTATPSAPVQQIPDGQIQAPTGSPVQQIPDGQIQAPTGAPVSQIPDGQIQAGNATRAATPTAPVAYTGAAALPTAHAAFGLAAGVLAIAML